MYALKPKLATYNTDNNDNIQYIREMLNVYLEISPYIDYLKYNTCDKLYNVNMILNLFSRIKELESFLDIKILNFIYCKNRNCVNKMVKLIKMASKGNNYDENLSNFCEIYYKIVEKLSTI